MFSKIIGHKFSKVAGIVSNKIVLNQFTILPVDQRKLIRSISLMDIEVSNRPTIEVLSGISIK